MQYELRIGDPCSHEMMAILNGGGGVSCWMEMGNTILHKKCDRVRRSLVFPCCDADVLQVVVCGANKDA